jgi:putative transposase
MPRIPRGLTKGFYYHIINRGNDKKIVFRKAYDYSAFLDLVLTAKERYPVKLIAYCLMPNHFHFVLSPEEENSLSAWMQWLMTSHVRRYHRHYESSGHVWQGRFKSFPIQGDNHLLVVMRYVEGNPVRAGLKSSARDWKWSSHLERTGKTPRILTDEISLVLPESWTAYVDQPWSEKDLEQVRESVNRQAPFGSSQWQSATSLKMGLESTIRPRGRPKKVTSQKK